MQQKFPGPPHFSILQATESYVGGAWKWGSLAPQLWNTTRGPHPSCNSPDNLSMHKETIVLRSIPSDFTYLDWLLQVYSRGSEFLPVLQRVLLAV